MMGAGYRGICRESRGNRFEKEKNRVQHPNKVRIPGTSWTYVFTCSDHTDSPRERTHHIVQRLRPLNMQCLQMTDRCRHAYRNSDTFRLNNSRY